MNDLTLPPNSPPRKPTWPPLSEALKQRLLGRGPLSDIVDRPELASECYAALPALYAVATAPASRDTIMEVLARRFALFPQPERTEPEWEAWWHDYIATLDGLPEGAIEAGMAAYVALHDSEFFPKPGLIRELAKTSKNDAAFAYHNANIAVGMMAAAPAHPVAELTYDERQAAQTKRESDRLAVQKMLRETVSSLTKPKASGPQLPPVQARDLSPGGVSAELLAKIQPIDDETGERDD